MTKSILLMLVFALLMACGVGSVADPNNSEPSKKSTESIKNDISETADEIQILIGEARCESDNECKAIAMGNKACGGPMFYLPYSITGIDVSKLETLAQKHRDLSKQYNQLTGMMSDCSFVMEPPVACIDSSCQIKLSN